MTAGEISLSGEKTSKIKSPGKNLIFITASLFLLAAVFVIALGRGSVAISPGEVIGILKGTVSGDDVRAQIIKNIRIPRAILAVLSGACLSAAGCLLQAVMQNPLADPGIIGVSSGAAFSAIVVLLIFPSLTPVLPFISFLGAMAATALVYFLAWKKGVTPLRLVLAGVAVNALLGGANALVSVLNPEKIQNIVLWINGSLALRSWHEVRLLSFYAVPGLLLTFLTTRAAGTLLLGDEKAKTLGLDVGKARLLLSVLAAFLAGTVTSLVGVIGFIGLVIPHISRMIAGSSYRILLPFSMINGAVFLLFADTLARTVRSPLEIPVGTMMAVFGAPFFIWLLRKENRI